MPPRYILTKTHCLGYGLGSCPYDGKEFSLSSFRKGCLSSLENNFVGYPLAMVHKAIHIMRHPLDNVVARFHHVSKNINNEDNNNNDNKNSTNNRTVLVGPNPNRTSFEAWCHEQDQADANRCTKHPWPLPLERAKNATVVPCYLEFFRYVQWHNHAFDVLDRYAHRIISPFHFYYEDYEHDFANTTTTILNVLEFRPNDRYDTMRANSVQFIVGKTYRDYYSPEQSKAIWTLLDELASPATRKALEYYKNPG